MCCVISYFDFLSRDFSKHNHFGGVRIHFFMVMISVCILETIVNISLTEPSRKNDSTGVHPHACLSYLSLMSQAYYPQTSYNALPFPSITGSHCNVMFYDPHPTKGSLMTSVTVSTPSLKQSVAYMRTEACLFLFCD